MAIRSRRESLLDPQAAVRLSGRDLHRCNDAVFDGMIRCSIAEAQAGVCLERLAWHCPLGPGARRSGSQGGGPTTLAMISHVAFLQGGMAPPTWHLRPDVAEIAA